MEKDKKKTPKSDLQQELNSSQQIYEPLTLMNWKQIRKECRRKSAGNQKKQFRKLFSDDNQFSSADSFDQLQIEPLNNPKYKVKKDKILSGIIKNSKVGPEQRNECTKVKQTQYFKKNAYDFNFEITPLTFQQTPIYRSIVQTPFPKFNQMHRLIIEDLKNKIVTDVKITELQLKTDPTLYKTEGAAFFIGLAMNVKNRGDNFAGFLFYKLACFIQPFNCKPWQQYLDSLKSQNLFTQTAIISKTAFLFRQNNQFAINYLASGDKCGIPMYSLRGLLASIKNPENYQKTIFQSAKLEIKNRKPWRGLFVLLFFCFYYEFKPGASQSIILLCKQLQILNYRQTSLHYLKIAFEKSLSTLEAYQLYLEILVRHRKGQLLQSDFDYLQQISEMISQQNRYKFLLDVAQLCKNNSQLFNKWILKSYSFIMKYCKKGLGQNRALRQLYFSLMHCKKILPPLKIMQQYQDDNNMIFEINRLNFIHGKQINRFQFSEWKYYIHYSLINDTKMLEIGIQKWPKIGRLLAELIQILRMTIAPLKILKYWRNRIQEIPKSGELWCEGGRIYTQLCQYGNAIKCFEFAIHFTPEFGDSFFQLLKVYLIKNCFYQIQRLKNIYLISDPIYGCIYTFWRYSGQIQGYPALSKLSLIQTWNLAQKEIEQQLYQAKTEKDKEFTMTASGIFNKSRMLCESAFMRQKMFLCYQQFDKKI